MFIYVEYINKYIYIYYIHNSCTIYRLLGPPPFLGFLQFIVRTVTNGRPAAICPNAANGSNLEVREFDDLLLQCHQTFVLGQLSRDYMGLDPEIWVKYWDIYIYGKYGEYESIIFTMGYHHVMGI